MRRWPPSWKSWAVRRPWWFAVDFALVFGKVRPFVGDQHMCFIYRNNHQQIHTKTNNNHQQSPKTKHIQIYISTYIFIYFNVYIFIYTRIIKKYLHISGPKNQTFPPRPRLEMGTRKPNLCRSRRWKVLRCQLTR